MIWEFCIRRPVLTSVLFAIAAIFGLYGFFQLPVRETPDVDFPIVGVNVVLPGGEPELIETEIVERLEEEINTIEGLKRLVSSSRADIAQITAEFELWRDGDVVVQDVRDRVERARRELPDGMLEPIVQKMDPDAQAILWIALQGDERWDPIRISEYADQVIKPRLETVRGVGRIQIGGEQRYAVRVRLDPARLAAHHLTVQDVVDTIRRNNVDIPAGRIQSEQFEFLVKTDGQFSAPEPLEALIVARRNGSVVRVGDVGSARGGVENDRQLARFAGEPTIGLGVIKQANANMVELAREVRERMAVLGTRMPPGLTYKLSHDASVHVEESLDDLVFTIFLATGLVVLVVLAFLGSWRSTFVICMAIPTSLLTALAVIDALGFSLNNLTMLGLILAIGVVVDDAIVVLESIYRHMERGAEPLAATRTGTTEVAFAAIANTVALSAVFIPVAFTGGMIGRFFYEFGVTVTATVVASTFVALMLTPMMCARLVRVADHPGIFFRATERAFAWSETVYDRVLRRALRQRGATVAIGALSFVVGLLFLRGVSQEFAPVSDRDGFMISFETAEGSTLAATDAFARAIEGELAKMPEVEHWFLAIGLSPSGGPGAVNTGVCMVHLLPRAERERRQVDLMQEARVLLDRLPGGRAFVVEMAGGGPPGAPVEYVLQHTDLSELALQQERLTEWMRAQPEFVGVNADLKMTKPQLRIHINRDKSSEMGISVADISTALRYLLAEPEISKIERGSRSFDVIPEVTSRGRMVPSAIGDVYVRSAEGRLVSLANLVELEETIGPSAINHYDRMRSVTVSASTPPGVSAGEAMAKLEQRAAETLPADFEFRPSGRAEAFRESFLYLSIALMFAIVFVYLVLAAQFESLIHPFTILMTLPLSAVGAFGGLWLFGLPLSIFAMIGLIMLLGLVTKNAILLIDYTNVLIARGSEAHAAVLEAGRVRMRPVLMTAASTVLGMLPVAFGYGAGGEARAPLGVCVAIGMISSTALTLVVIPVLYTLIHDLGLWLRSRRGVALRGPA